MNNYALPPGSSERFPPCTDDELAVVEKALGARFPDEYREFLLEHNGPSIGDIDHMVGFPLQGIEEWEDLGIIDEMLAVINDAKHNRGLLAAQTAYEFSDRVPPGIIAIGGVSVSKVCVSVRSSDYGEIYFWDPLIPFEEDDKDNEKTDKYLKPVASNFREFWDRLIPDADF